MLICISLQLNEMALLGILWCSINNTLSNAAAVMSHATGIHFISQLHQHAVRLTYLLLMNT